MKMSKDLLDTLTAQAKASPRLRMNYDLRNSPEDQSHRLECLESGTVIVEFKDGAYEPVGAEDFVI